MGSYMDVVRKKIPNTFPLHAKSQVQGYVKVRISVWRIFFRGDFFLEPMGNYVGRVYGINLFLSTDLSKSFVLRNNQTEQNFKPELLLIFSFTGAHKSVSTTNSPPYFYLVLFKIFSADQQLKLFRLKKYVAVFRSSSSQMFFKISQYSQENTCIGVSCYYVLEMNFNIISFKERLQWLLLDT